MRSTSLAALMASVVMGVATGAAAADLNLYTARHYDTDNALYEGFTKLTGFKVRLVEDTAEKLIERIKAEGVNSPCDVFVTVDAGRLQAAEDQGIYQPVKSAVLEEKIPAALRDPGGQWFGFSKRARVIVYNKAKVKPSELSTYEDLADPKWKGRILMRSSTNIYNLSLTGSILAANGPEKTEAWARGFAANFARPPRGGDTDQIKGAAAGEGDVAISNTYYLARLVNSKKPEDKAVADKVGVFFPNQKDRGTHVNISGAGVCRHAPNREAAVKFLEYLASPEAQKIFAIGNYEYPVVAGAELHPTLVAWGEFKADGLNAKTFAKNSAEALKIMDRAGWR
ncbi:Fe(3+) ABC transporter substrate-binding protein [Stella sp.]|uniref:Fe(3+) ABC transporter substrate-binding protein n=1 Tax=Stella sp. TaxID=2912054 RepID=UPI0035B46EF5